mmetsp:Transcript_94026/g.186426  ORF Transcript_94026/g.186426 Transcript_94026/m.186426 type:complete len:202 (-) Transcript_94026:70-675(-)
MGSSHTHQSHKPYTELDQSLLSQKGVSKILPPSSSWSPAGVEVGSIQVDTIKEVGMVYWCSEPLETLVGNLLPRGPMRLFRKLQGRAGPASVEVGHSYVVVSVRAEPNDSWELWRLNWGAARLYPSNLCIDRSAQLPQNQLFGDRLERAWEGTCSGPELAELLRKWNGRSYDANPCNNRQCHHFAQDVIGKCTHHQTGYSG